jgi:hypothetical protein
VVATLDARDLESGQTREVQNGMRKVVWYAGFANVAGDAPPTEEFHRARVVGAGTRMPDRTVALLDQDARNPAPAQVARKGQTHRTSAGN